MDRYLRNESRRVTNEPETRIFVDVYDVERGSELVSERIRESKEIAERNKQLVFEFTDNSHFARSEQAPSSILPQQVLDHHETRREKPQDEPGPPVQSPIDNPASVLSFSDLLGQCFFGLLSRGR